MSASSRFASAGALVSAMAVGVGAYASHVADARDQHRLALAALFAFGHGLALLASARMSPSRLATTARLCWLSGIAFFSGAMVAATFFGTSTASVPLGGSLMIVGWFFMAAALWRER